MPMFNGFPTKGIVVSGIADGLIPISSTAQTLTSAAALNFNDTTGVLYAPNIRCAPGVTNQDLADYAEGTWTPILKASGNIGAATTYIVQAGYYYLFGSSAYPCAFVTCYIQINAKDAALSGSLYVDGLPWACNTTGIISPMFDAYYNGLQAAVFGVFGRVPHASSATSIALWMGLPGGSIPQAMNQGGVTNGSAIKLAGLIAIG